MNGGKLACSEYEIEKIQSFGGCIKLDFTKKIKRVEQIVRDHIGGRQRDFSPFVLTLEPSYACNLACRMCVRGNDIATGAIMSEEVFARIVPYLPRFYFIHLCGFGEPLMNPRLEEMIKRIGKNDCLVSFVTNGLLLTPERAKKILSPELRIKEIAVSIDAATKETYEAIRGKGNFTKLLENLRELKKQKEKAVRKPKLTWAYLVMKSNFRELPAAVELAAELGFDRLVGEHVETARDAQQLSEAMFDTGIAPPLDEKTEKEFQAVLKEARRRARKSHIKFQMHPRRMILDRTCASQPLRALYIDHAGNVSSCCYLNVLNVRPYLKSTDQPGKGVLGNITRNTLEEILGTREFQEFISSWARKELPPICRACLLARRMQL